MRHTPPLPDVPEPMWYAAGPALIDTRGGPLAQKLAAACRARWQAPFVIDLQTPHLDPGAAAAPPEPRPVWSPRWTATAPADEIALLIDASAPLLATADGAPLPHHGEPHFIRADTALAGLRWATDPARVTLALARRAAPAEHLDHRRRSARVFCDGNRVVPPDEPIPAWAEDRSLVFHSGFRTLARLPAFTPAQIAREPIPDLCHPSWVAEHGGPIARAFVATLPDSWFDPANDAVIVGRINELDPGWWPCIAGWHYDGTSRINKRPDGNPDLKNPGVRIENILCSVGETGLTGFLAGRVAVPDIPHGMARGIVKPWQQRFILEAIARGELTELHARPGEVIALEHGDHHDCRPSHQPGWRYFIKAMRGRGDPRVNAFAERGQLSWPYETGHWPQDPLGVFPTALPPGVRDDATAG
ncbi:MAG: hypothetical protein R3F65_15115 [bacterium]